MSSVRLRSAVERPYVPLAAIGAALVLVTSVLGAGFSLFTLPFVAWSLLPYGALWFAGRAGLGSWPVLGAGAFAIAAESGVRAAVFLWPRGSTAGVALVFSPVYIAAVVMPGGALAGWIFGRAWSWNAPGRAGVLVLSPLLLGLLTLGLARPDLFPTTVAARRAVLARVGPPRVVTGGDRFVSVAISTRPARLLAAELDGEPGDDLAIVDHPDRSTIYDEILDHYPRVLVARRADGSDAIAVAGERGARLVRPR
jgi:hypothetical protein